MNELRQVYVDHAATTPLDPEVLAVMEPYLRDRFGNPSSLHAWGRATRAALDDARDRVGALLGVDGREVVFTSGGSEAVNLALKGVALAGGRRSGHLVVSSVEHHAVLDTAAFLEKLGFAVTRLPVDAYGRVDPARVAEALRPDTILVSVMHGNNEVGTVQPIEAIGRICRERGVLFHTDAVQTVGYLPVDLRELPVDLLSLSAHKFHGPKGAGALVVRRGVRLEPLVHGGGQERGRRAGTENVAGLVGMARALEIACQRRAHDTPRLARLRDRLIAGLLSVPGVHLAGHPVERLPGNVHVCIEGVESESLLLQLDLHGVAASAGSACTSGSLVPSHVLRAMGVPETLVRGSLRLTLGRGNTEEEIDYLLDLLPALIGRVRETRRRPGRPPAALSAAGGAGGEARP